MKKILFLEGPIQTGKSTLIREVLGARLSKCGGFASQRLVDADGQTQGFRIGPAAVTALTAPLAEILPRRDSFTVLPHVLRAPDGTSYDNVFKYFAPDGSTRRVYTDQSVFERYAVDMLRASVDSPLILLDEIGGAELLCEPFRRILDELLSSGTPCLGVLKLNKNARRMQRAYNIEGSDQKTPSLQTEPTIADWNQDLRRQIPEKYHGEILYYDRSGENGSDPDLVRKILNEYCDIVFN